jgi:hypothetical protein
LHATLKDGACLFGGCRRSLYGSVILIFALAPLVMKVPFWLRRSNHLAIERLNRIMA